ncbi:hypothetical protein BJ742DRAFT_328042 [Cladochytrium replicatum]|nr:hypothetical protein BJ742DRAFT_328042 [Cladochytrium replicatum]
MSPEWVWFLVVGMLFTGTINTLLNKYQDFACVGNCDDPDPTKRVHFEQPVWQTLNMFVGEALCLLVYYVSVWYESYKKSREPAYHPISTSDDAADDDVGNSAVSPKPHDALPLTGWRQLLLWIPTLCDMTATTLMNVGLIYISASIYQMLRGSVVLFTGTLSALFLGRKNPVYKWFALITVFVGVAIVGLSGLLSSASENADGIKTNPIGVFLVASAQIFTAMQFVIEEKIMSRYEAPAIKVVGLEGIFGLISVLGGMPILYYTIGKNGEKGNFFDLPEGFRQVFFIPQVLYCGIGIIFSIAFFNWFGLSVTRTISATSRSTIDTCRTLFIWIVSLSLGWETFKPLQVVGFLVLLYGTFLFNDAISPPPFQVCLKGRDDEEVPHNFHPSRGVEDD